MRTSITNARDRVTQVVLAGLLGAAMLFTVTPTAFGQTCEAPVAFAGSTHEISYCGVKFGFPDLDKTTFFYCLTGDAGTGINSISHHVVEVSACLLEAFVEAGQWADDDSSPTGPGSNPTLTKIDNITTGVDGSTGITGVKFNEGFSNIAPNSRYRYLMFSGNIGVGSWLWTAKDGAGAWSVTVPGPSADCEPPPEVLPVELSSFEAIVDERDVVLTWTTESETDNAGFALQQSENDEEWTEITFVTGTGTTTEPISYTFRVEDVDPGLQRFRLKQVDFDGAFEYGPTVEVMVELPGTHQLSDVYPNPFNPTTSFSLAVSREQMVQIDLYDVLGRRVRSLYSGAFEANASKTFSVDANGLTSGSYLILVIGEDFRESRRLTLLK